ncbi:hypothetical protein Taro_045422 [Colocasia esculenta]|uniref:Uncharacterized protein n=1 Tax=Colocasia esculenta TaxID=4460 RepID=A0A843WX07_COLES|nr:hypothetical protein [Colocasia esculenta]
MDFDEYDYLEKTVENPEVPKVKLPAANGVQPEDSDHDKGSRGRPDEGGREGERTSRRDKLADGVIFMRHKEKKEEGAEPEVDPERDQRTVFAYQISLKADERDVYEFFSRAGKSRLIWTFSSPSCFAGIKPLETCATLLVDCLWQDAVIKTLRGRMAG